MKKLAVAAVVLARPRRRDVRDLYVIRSRPDRTVVKVTDAPPRAADALAEQIMSSGRETETSNPATRETTPATADEPRPGRLVPARRRPAAR